MLEACGAHLKRLVVSDWYMWLFCGMPVFASMHLPRLSDGGLALAFIRPFHLPTRSFVLTGMFRLRHFRSPIAEV